MCSKRNHWSRRPIRSEGLLRWLRRPFGAKIRKVQTTSFQTRAHTKATGTLGHREGEQLGEDASYNQPWRLREKIHSGRWRSNKLMDTLFQLHNIQNITWPWTLSKRLNNRESLRATSGRKSRKQIHFHHRRLNGMAGGRVRGGTNRGNWKKDTSAMASSVKWECFWWPRQRGTTRAAGENTLTAQNAVLFLHTKSPVEFTALLSQGFGIFQPTVVQISALCLRRTDILDSLWLTMCCRFSYCNGSTRKKSRWVPTPHSYTAHITYSVFWSLQKT